MSSIESGDIKGPTKDITTYQSQQKNELENQISTFQSADGHKINVVRSMDNQLALEQLGYKQELERKYTLTCLVLHFQL